jgi:hypothetical protein
VTEPVEEPEFGEEHHGHGNERGEGEQREHFPANGNPMAFEGERAVEAGFEVGSPRVGRRGHSGQWGG